MIWGAFIHRSFLPMLPGLFYFAAALLRPKKVLIWSLIIGFIYTPLFFTIIGGVRDEAQTVSGPFFEYFFNFCNDIYFHFWGIYSANEFHYSDINIIFSILYSILCFLLRFFFYSVY